MTDASEWRGRVGASWASQWRRTDRSFTGLTPHLLDRAAALAPDAAAVLDIGCGAGSTSIALAGRLTKASVLGVDISPDLIAVATARLNDESAGNCHFQLADAAVWNDPDFRPDLLMSRHGVMFFDAPVDAFAHLRQVSAPGAGLVFSCFRAASGNSWMGSVADLLPGGPPPAPPPGAPGPFAFADEGRVRGILSGGGWRAIEAEPLDFRYIAGAGDDAVADAVAFFRNIGPVARALSELGPEESAALLDRLTALAEAHREGGEVSFPAAAWIWTARAP